MPHASVIFNPRRWYHSNNAGDTAAEPQPRIRAWCRPRPRLIFAFTKPLTNGILSRKLSLCAGIFCNTPIWKRVHRRGTEINSVGSTDWILLTKVSSDSTNETTPSPA